MKTVHQEIPGSMRKRESCNTQEPFALGVSEGSQATSQVESVLPPDSCLRTSDSSASPTSSAVSLSVVEAKLAGGGTLVESPSNGTHSGRKWRVLVFEYGLSKNRYPFRESGFGNRESAFPAGMALSRVASAESRDRKSTRLNSSHSRASRMPSSA